MREIWDLIPHETDILVTHGPARNRRDFSNYTYSPAGCDDLLSKIKEIHPKLHVCGHIHSGYGVEEVDGITHVNAASCDEAYNPINPVIMIDYPETPNDFLHHPLCKDPFCDGRSFFSECTEDL